MARNDPQVNLRISAELKLRLETAARASGRSLTAEVIQLIEAGFAHRSHEDQLESHYNERLRSIIEESARQIDDLLSIPPESTLYVVLDADGFPISWQEIYLHLSEISRAGKLKIDSLEARIVNANMQSNNAREDEWMAIIKRYKNEQRKARKQGKPIPITEPSR